jgi:hypothetical protein
MVGPEEVTLKALGIVGKSKTLALPVIRRQRKQGFYHAVGLFQGKSGEQTTTRIHGE